MLAVNLLQILAESSLVVAPQGSEFSCLMRKLIGMVATLSANKSYYFLFDCISTAIPLDNRLNKEEVQAGMATCLLRALIRKMSLCSVADAK